MGFVQQHDGVHQIHWGKRWGFYSNMMGLITDTGVRDGVLGSGLD